MLLLGHQILRNEDQFFFQFGLKEMESSYRYKAFIDDIFFNRIKHKMIIQKQNIGVREEVFSIFWSTIYKGYLELNNIP